MRIALLADIHANREALEAALQCVRSVSPDLIVVLGDIVGYGPDPEFAIDTVARLRDDGAVCLKGNHDEAAVTGPKGMSENARIAANWTMVQLSDSHRALLDGLPMEAVVEGVRYVHASAERPERWIYLNSADAAVRCLAACDERIVACGHTHVPAIHYALPGRGPVQHTPAPGVAAPIMAMRRHVVVCGSVGQPRDGNPAACIGVIDTRESSVTMLRAPYDYDVTRAKIARAGLPDWLGIRLKIGR